MRDTSGQILICKDGGLLVKDDQRLQLSREQVKVLAACFSGRLDEREHALLLVRRAARAVESPARDQQAVNPVPPR